jgi:type VI secretion system protein ImpL
MQSLIDLLKRLPLAKLGTPGKIIAVILPLLILAYATGWLRWLGGIGVWFWWGLLFLLAVGIVVAVLWGIPRYREQRFLDRLRSEDAKAPDEIEESHAQIREKMLEAIRTLKNSPELKKKGGLPLYALPWYLFIGASQTGKTTLLREVAQFLAPLAPSSSLAEGPTPNCDWWFFNTAIILDTTGRYAFLSPETRDGTGWYRFLRLLRHYRDLQPINGLLIAVAADTLASQRPEELRRDTAELRKRIDETIRELGVYFPIYVLITRCDLIEGFTEFFDCLPEQTWKQVFGYINEMQPKTGTQQPQPVSPQDFATIFAGFVERLQQLRLSIYNEEKIPSETRRQKIFCFPEEFRALQQPLSTFVETLFAENPYQYTPFFRGIFFSSVPQGGTPLSLLRRQLRIDTSVSPLARSTKTYFLHDLFSVVLPRDQYLVQTTAKASRGRLFKHLFGLVGSLVLALALVVLLTQAYRSDQQILAATNKIPCEATVGQPDIGLLLDQVEQCRQVVQKLTEQNQQRSVGSKKIFKRSVTLENQLRQRYVEKFSTEILPPLDTPIEQYLLAGTNPIPLVFLLIKRIELINQCLANGECPATLAKERQPDYALMLNAAQQPPSPAPEQVTMLARTYETYLQWSLTGETGIYQEQEALAERLRRWFSATQFAPQQILQWVNQNYAPVTLQEYWELPLSPSEKKTVRVEGGYTKEAWEGSLLPFLQRAREAVPDVESLLKEFTLEYRTQYFEQWQRFLTDFPRGESPWWKTREQRYQLALKLLDANSPYNRIIDVAFENLKPFLPIVLAIDPALTEAPAEQPTTSSANLLQRVYQAVKQLVGLFPRAKELPPGEQIRATPSFMDIDTLPLPAWAQILHHYIGSESRKAYLAALKQISEQLADVSPIEKSFQLAQTGFQEGKPSEQSAHPVLKSWGIIQQFREKEKATGEKGSGAEVFWLLLERPVLFVWKTILEQAGVFLQKNWGENVITPTSGLSTLEQLNFLYGSPGKVREFVTQSVAPFLIDNEARPGQVLGEQVPLSEEFFKTLGTEKQLKPILEIGGKTPQRVRVEATRESMIDSATNLVEERTEFSVECAGKTSRVNTRPKDITEALTDVLWSFDGCGDVLITITLSCERPCVERAAALGLSVPEMSSLRVTKRYTGQDSFLRFIQDFSSGSHTFKMSDFAESYPASLWSQIDAALRPYRVQAIKVFYRVEVPPALAKLVSLMPGSMIAPTIIK